MKISPVSSVLLFPLKHMLRRHPLWCYFLLAYSFAWLGWLPYLLSSSGLGLLQEHIPTFVLPIAVYGPSFLGPTLAAFLVTTATSGKSGLCSLLRSFVLWRVGWRWYLIALAGIPGMWILGAIVQSGPLAVFRAPELGSALLSYFPALVLTLLASGLSEEPGWRGFALPHLQKRYGPLPGTLILGFLWGSWHIPLFLHPAFAGSGLLAISQFIFVTIVLALIFTWVFNHTQGSLLLAMLLHAAVDAFAPTPAFSGPLASTPSHALLGFGMVALLLILVTRGRLGYLGQSV